MMTPSEIETARQWIAECVWADLDEDSIAELTPRQIERGIARHFTGGIEGFRATMQEECQGTPMQTPCQGATDPRG